ncbi:MAG: sigma-70 family RNA polymerase sigma factor [Bacteroidetes bacterium]|nr:sigma-70 family RNA polymerase sigma factor [Bacteroidota bacterium]
MISEAELIKGCLEGKKDIQKQFYHRYASTMLGVCCRYFDTREEAEDALQEGFIKVFTNLGSFRNEGSLEGWIRRIIINTSLNLIRNHLKYQFHTSIEEAESQVIDDSDIVGEMSREEMLKLLQDLPPGYRLVFNFYEIEGYSHKEIADMLAISVSTSKTQLLKARKWLQKRLFLLNQEKLSAST